MIKSSELAGLYYRFTLIQPSI